MKKKYKINKKRLLLLLVLFFAGLFIFSGLKIISYLVDNKENRSIKNITEESININKSEDSKEDNYIVNFNELKELNPDTVAYLKVNGTNIDYVVVKGKDNSYYLKHNFNKSYNTSGWIFADYHNRFDGTDKNIVIYGHNTRDGSMFGTLRNVLKNDWQINKENEIIVLVTEKGTYYYQVFSTYTIMPEDYYINTIFKNDNEYSNFLNKINSRSNYNYGINVNKEDSILTLSTCTANGTKRVVLHAKLVKD